MTGEKRTIWNDVEMGGGVQGGGGCQCVCVCVCEGVSGVGEGGRGGTIISWHKTTNSCNRGEVC